MNKKKNLETKLKISTKSCQIKGIETLSMEQWNIRCIMQEKQTKNDLKLIEPDIYEHKLGYSKLKRTISKNQASNEHIDGKE